MNAYQEVWWRQAQSDHAALVLLRGHGADPCHQLHYLQMTTEKVGKAYVWKSGAEPPRSHAGFVQFMRSLGGTQQPRRRQTATSLDFKIFSDLQSWTRAALPMVYALERLAPALAQDGPNPEYTWPPAKPAHSPAGYLFPIWGEITRTGRGRRLLRFIQFAVERFPD